MEKKIVLKGRKITGGVAEGIALVTRLPFGFTHGVDPLTGEVTDVRHELKGENIKDRILVFPYGKSSSSGALWILETVRCGNAPAAIINVEVEPIIGGGCFLAGVLYGKPIVLVDRTEKNPCEVIKTGDHVRVNGETGFVEVWTTA